MAIETQIVNGTTIIVQENVSFDWTSFLIAFSAIMGLVITVLLHHRSSNADRKLRFIEILEKFEHDISSVFQRQFSSTTLETDIRSLRDNLHILQRLAYLRKLNKIDDDMMRFFESKYGMGATLLKLLEILHRDDANERVFPHVLWWIEQNQIKPDNPDSLPPRLINLYHQASSGKRLAMQNGKMILIQSDKPINH